jgi:glucokinase
VNAKMKGRDYPIETKLAIGLDVGGTKISGGVVRNGELVERKMIPTPCGGEDALIVDILYDFIAQLRSEYPSVGAVGVGAAGLVEWPSGYIHWAPNNNYRKVDLRRSLAEMTGLPVIVDNDANVMAWAEYQMGVSRVYKHRHVICLTVGTGIGGGIILDGELFRGRTGLGTEIGHIVLDSRHGVQCGCGSRGCLETVASGKALARLGRAAALADPAGPLVTLAGDVEKVTGVTVTQCASQGDSTAVNLLAEIGHWLGVGIASLVSLFEPEVVVIGGGLAVAAGELILGPTRASLAECILGGSHCVEMPPIVPAELGVDAGIIGAAILAVNCLTGAENAMMPSQGRKVAC